MGDLGIAQSSGSYKKRGSSAGVINASKKIKKPAKKQG
jgi:hypothetical protein